MIVLEAIVGLGHDVHLASLTLTMQPNAGDKRILGLLNITVHQKPIMGRDESLTEYRHVTHCLLFFNYNISILSRQLLNVIKPNVVIMWLWFWKIDFTVPGNYLVFIVQI